MSERKLNTVDWLIANLDKGLRTLSGHAPGTRRPNPASGVRDDQMSESARRQAGRLMRVNHAGEVAAQALYHGQALAARSQHAHDLLERAASEEGDHLSWCAQRLDELGSRTSLLNPAWYLGSVTIGAVAGFAGDRWSLGFLAETERQVVEHLTIHLQRLPEADRRSRAILEQMRDDESQHATSALGAGGYDLPLPARIAMRWMSRVMTRTANFL